MSSLRALFGWAEPWRRRRAAADRVYGINRRNVELVYRHNQREDYPIADDKILCKEILARHDVPVTRTITTCRALFEVEARLGELFSRGEFVVKPASGSGGDGIVVLGERVPGGWYGVDGRLVSHDELRQHFASIVFGSFAKQMEDRVLVEERIRPHPLFEEFWQHGVCDLRVLVLEHRPLLAMLRIPTLRSKGRANLHQGGIGVALNLESGLTVRAVHQGVAIERHPETGTRLIGRQLPHWDTLLEAACAAARAVPLGYLGVDLTVDRSHGPLVIEINARPGLEIQNVHATALGELEPLREAP